MRSSVGHGAGMGGVPGIGLREREVPAHRVVGIGADDDDQGIPVSRYHKYPPLQSFTILHRAVDTSSLSAPSSRQGGREREVPAHSVVDSGHDGEEEMLAVDGHHSCPCTFVSKE